MTTTTEFLDYEAAAALFRAAGFKCGAANARRLIRAHPTVCPIARINYHTPRIPRVHLLKLVAQLAKERDNSQ